MSLIMCQRRLRLGIRGSIVVSIPACHAGDRGSIPRHGDFFLHRHDQPGKDRKTGNFGSINFVFLSTKKLWRTYILSVVYSKTIEQKYLRVQFLRSAENE